MTFRMGNEKCHLLRQIHIKILNIQISFLIKLLPSYARDLLMIIENLFDCISSVCVCVCVSTHACVCVRKPRLYPQTLFSRDGDYSYISQYHVKSKTKLLFDGYHCSMLSFVQNVGMILLGDPLVKEKLRSPRLEEGQVY